MEKPEQTFWPTQYLERKLLGHKVTFQGKPFSITVIQVYAPTTNAEETEVEQFYEDLQDLLEHQKRCPFHQQGTGRQKWEVKRYLD